MFLGVVAEVLKRVVDCRAHVVLSSVGCLPPSSCCFALVFRSLVFLSILSVSLSLSLSLCRWVWPPVPAHLPAHLHHKAARHPITSAVYITPVHPSLPDAVLSLGLLQFFFFVLIPVSLCFRIPACHSPATSIPALLSVTSLESSHYQPGAIWISSTI